MVRVFIYSKFDPSALNAGHQTDVLLWNVEILAVVLLMLWVYGDATFNPDFTLFGFD